MRGCDQDQANCDLLLARRYDHLAGKAAKRAGEAYLAGHKWRHWFWLHVAKDYRTHARELGVVCIMADEWAEGKGTFRDYCDYAAAYYVDQKDMESEDRQWRFGQTYFNILVEWQPEIAATVRGSLIDPFYQDTKIEPFLLFVAERWPIDSDDTLSSGPNSEE